MKKKTFHSNKILLTQTLQPTTYLLTLHMSAERQIHDASRIQSHSHSVIKNSHFLHSEFYTFLANLGIISMYLIEKERKRIGMDGFRWILNHKSRFQQSLEHTEFTCQVQGQLSLKKNNKISLAGLESTIQQFGGLVCKRSKYLTSFLLQMFWEMH